MVFPQLFYCHLHVCIAYFLFHASFLDSDVGCYRYAYIGSPKHIVLILWHPSMMLNSQYIQIGKEKCSFYFPTADLAFFVSFNLCLFHIPLPPYWFVNAYLSFTKPFLPFLDQPHQSIQFSLIFFKDQALRSLVFCYTFALHFISLLFILSFPLFSLFCCAIYDFLW